MERTEGSRRFKHTVTTNRTAGTGDCRLFEWEQFCLSVSLSLSPLSLFFFAIVIISVPPSSTQPIGPIPLTLI